MLKIMITLSATADKGLDSSKVEALYNSANCAKDIFMASLEEFGIVEKTPFKIAISELEE
jgi:hypothetical protein